MSKIKNKKFFIYSQRTKKNAQIFFVHVLCIKIFPPFFYRLFLRKKKGGKKIVHKNCAQKKKIVHKKKLCTKLCTKNRKKKRDPTP